MSKLKKAVNTVVNAISAKFNIVITPPPLSEKDGGVVIRNDNAKIEWQSLNRKHARISVPMTMLFKKKTVDEASDIASKVQEYLTESEEDFADDEIHIDGFEIINGACLEEKDNNFCIYKLQFSIRYSY